MTKKALLLPILLLPLGNSWAAAEAPTQDERCTKGVEKCVAEMREQFKARGTVGMMIRPGEPGSGEPWRVCEIVPNRPAEEAGGCLP